MYWEDTFDYAHIYTSFAYKGQGGITAFCQIANHAGVNTYSFTEIGQSFDSTILLRVAGVGVFLSPEPFNFYEWHFYDLDVNLSDVGGFLQITVNHFRIDGIDKYSGTTLTSTLVSSLPTGIAKSNRILYNGGTISTLSFYDDLSVLAPPLGTARNVRATQGIIEALIKPDSARIRATQGLAEVLIRPSTAQIRVTQGFIELIISRTQVVGSGWQVKEC